MRRALLPLAVILLAAGHLFTTILHWRCPLAWLTHHPCPTCGITTATKLLLHGKLHAALAVHPLVLVVVPLVATVGVLEAWTYLRTGKLDTWTEKRPVRIAIVTTAIALFVLWIARFFGAFGGPVIVG